MKRKVTRAQILKTPAIRERAHKALADEKSRHGKCTNWIRENRRRRSTGLPQKRVLPFGLGIFDPIDRTVSRTLSDGTTEVLAA